MQRLAAALVVLVLSATTVAAAPEPEDVVGERNPTPGVAVLPGEPEFGDQSSPIRPGATLRVGTGTTVGPAEVVTECTFNFVFYDPTTTGAPPVYIGTAGHCTARLGQRVSVGAGPTIGRVAYDSDLAGSAADFALVRIDAKRVSQTNPTVLGWGGPRGIAATGALGQGDQIDVHGNGLVVGQHAATRSRWGVLVGWNAREYAADLPAVDGDSGAPLLHHPTGRALGIVSRYGVGWAPPTTDAGPRLSWIMTELRKFGFGDLVLATAS